ncbi:hypothetical protein HPG69_017170 [Diceros bicornis minor]|uniref:Solute carrier organic anion transporter family member n=1 Tax=Diceros bicornis minor TaxID=77932 RepID=A0A7J7ECL3_DICBM|nr:hypothetical protein HPG69_017170 [Diceros bicornis minor]
MDVINRYWKIRYRSWFCEKDAARRWEVEPGGENSSHSLGREKERLLLIKVSHLRVPDADTCLTTRNRTSCTSSSSSLSSYLYVFILGQLLLGTGGTPLYTLGTAFIDDSVPTHKSSLYIGIGYSMSILGPAIGYVLGGQLLTLYIDVGTAKIQDGKTSQTHQNKSSSLKHTDENFGKSFKDFPAALKNLMRNTVFMCLVVSTSSEALVTTGFATFLPKFIENQFGLSSSFAATLGGAVLIPGAALGQILGGVLVSKFKMACKNTMKFALLTSMVALVLSFVFLYANCENEPFAGVSESYNGTGELGNLTAPCNADCNCMRSYYYPLCGGNGVQYFSPCFAGCKSSVSKSKSKVYYNCSCIERKTEITPTAASSGFEAKAGKCETRCKHLPIFLGIFFVTVIFTFMAGTPITVSILRCVDQRQRALALGIQFMLLRLLGTIPGPIIFGVTIDSTCILWDINECGIKGACWMYDNIKMAHMLVAICVTCKVITISFNGLAVFLYKPPPVGTNVSFQNQKAVNVISTNQEVKGEIEKEETILQRENSPSFVHFIGFLLKRSLNELLINVYILKNKIWSESKGERMNNGIHPAFALVCNLCFHRQVAVLFYYHNHWKDFQLEEKLFSTKLLDLYVNNCLIDEVMCYQRIFPIFSELQGPESLGPCWIFQTSHDYYRFILIDIFTFLYAEVVFYMLKMTITFSKLEGRRSQIVFLKSFLTSLNMVNLNNGILGIVCRINHFKICNLYFPINHTYLPINIPPTKGEALVIIFAP